MNLNNYSNTMKTTLLLLLTSGSIISSLAQSTSPDLTFEQWEIGTFMGETYNTVKGWSSSNINNVISGEEESVEKTTDAFEGSFAMKLTNKPNTHNMPARAMSMNSLPDNEFYDRFPVTQKFTSLNGYFKYDPAEDDTFNIMIMMFKDGDPIGYGEFGAGGEHLTYETFSAPITYFMNDIPDSASMSIWVSRDGFKEGSILTIDNFSFGTGTTGLIEKSKISFRCEVSPNPSQGKFILSYEQLKKGNTTIYVYDLLGNEVKQIKNNRDAGEQELSIDCTDLKQGLYLLKLDQSGVEKTMRISIQ